MSSLRNWVWIIFLCFSGKHHHVWCHWRLCCGSGGQRLHLHQPLIHHLEHPQTLPQQQLQCSIHWRALPNHRWVIRISAMPSNQRVGSLSFFLPQQDYIMITVWVVLGICGIVLQLYYERSRPFFPPSPYLMWQQERERRTTNVLDPSHHFPSLPSRFLARARQLTKQREPAGEHTPLLL